MPIKEQAYKAAVKPTLELASSVWNPHTVKNMNKQGAVQRRTACWVVNRHRQTSTVDAMYMQLQWRPL